MSVDMESCPAGKKSKVIAARVESLNSAGINTNSNMNSENISPF